LQIRQSVRIIEVMSELGGEHREIGGDSQHNVGDDRVPRNPRRRPSILRRPQTYPRELRVTPAAPPAATKTGWDKAAVLLQAIGTFAIFVSTRRPQTYPRELKVTPAAPPAATKTGWDKAAVLLQAIGTFAIFVSIAALVIGVLQFNEQQRTSAKQLLDQQRQATLNGYFDDMSALVLQSNLTESKSGAPVRAIALARTATAVRNLDGVRKGYLIRYLWEADLITTPLPTLDLSGVNLHGAVFTGANLYQVNLSSLDLSNADFTGAALDASDLSGSDLSGAKLNGTNIICFSQSSNSRTTNVCANLRDSYLAGASLIDADLTGADLTGADLTGADLTGADLTGADLTGVNLTGANLRKVKYNSAMIEAKNAQGEALTEKPTRWPRTFRAKAAGAICVDC
jgi:uncharacterized protein YjbI with pentapeptide repeats